MYIVNSRSKLKKLITLVEDENNFLKNLIYRIGVEDAFIKSMPLYEDRLNECLLKIDKRLLNLNYRDLYKEVMRELQDHVKQLKSD